MQLVARDLAYSYASGSPAILDGAEFEVTDGSPTAVIGPSGAGKSTLLALLGGLLRPTRGSVDLVHGGGLRELEASTAWVFQTMNVLPERTALDNVAIGSYTAGLGVSAAQRDAARWLEAVRLTNRSHARARLLSGGELQRVVIARALASRRPVILADEPTGQLDRATTRHVLDVLVEAAEDRIIVIVTHDLEAASRCPSVLLLQDGRLVDGVHVGNVDR